MRLPQAAVYEVATFYSHFDVVKEGDTPPPPTTIRICDSITCELKGAEALLASLKAREIPPRCASSGPPAWAAATPRRSCEVGHLHVDYATVDSVRQWWRAAGASRRFPLIRIWRSIGRQGGYSILGSCRSGELNVDAVIAQLSDGGLSGLGRRGVPHRAQMADRTLLSRSPIDDH